MPHIAIEVSPSLLPSIQWEPVLHAMHLALAKRGWARLADLKSRVAPIAVGLCGDDPHAQQLIATLTLTNPRPPQMCSAMAEVVFEHLSRAIGAIGAIGPFEAPPESAAWVQCCVFLQEHPKSHYLKRQWNAPPPAPSTP